MNKIKVLLVDDHAIVAQGLKNLIEGFDFTGKVDLCHNGKEAVKKVKENSYDIILMDVTMPEMNGIEATEAILKIKPNQKILGLSMHSDESLIAEMIRKGAKGYILKDSEISEIQEGILTVINGSTYLSKKASEALINMIKKPEAKTKESANHPLTKREIEILRYILEGYTNKEIAEKLHLSSRTIDAHRRNILQKTGCKNTAALVKWALDNELLN
jgi:DNA-binding NarL/FixJ family response regulator